MIRPVKFEHGVPKVSQKIAEFMASIKAKTSGRYALECVGIMKSQMAVTDGRRLLVVTPTDTFDPPISDGTYYLTGEGFLLKTSEEGKFPKWQDIVPKDPNTLGAFALSDGNGTGIAKAIAAISETKSLFNMRWIIGALAGLERCGCTVVGIEKQEGEHPVLITAGTAGMSFQYIQMPFNNLKTLKSEK